MDTHTPGEDSDTEAGQDWPEAISTIRTSKRWPVQVCSMRERRNEEDMRKSSKGSKTDLRIMQAENRANEIPMRQLSATDLINYRRLARRAWSGR